MFRWIQSIGLENKLIFLRDQYALEFDGNWSWVKNSLPFALWLTSSVLMFHGVWGPVKSKPAVIWSTIFIVGSVFSEFSQKCKLLPGTYDPTDLIVIFCIGVFYYLVLICSKQKKKEVHLMTMSNRSKHLVTAVLVGFLIILAVGSTDTEEETVAVKEQAASYTISANAICSEYESNEVAADSKYKGKVIIVTGVIQDIGKDILDKAYIVVGGQGFLDGVQCTFAESQNSVIAQLSKGKSVKVKGKVNGKRGNVQLEKCSLQ